MIGAASCTAEEFGAAVEYIAGGHLPDADLITGSVGLADVNDAFDDLIAPGNAHLKILVTPAG
jgi:threonine dehydrogenase-like Zn-dependent dehydrogenase